MSALATILAIIGIVLFALATVRWLPRAFSDLADMRVGDVAHAVGVTLLWILGFLALLPVMLVLTGFPWPTCVIGFLLWLAAIFVTLAIVARLRQSERRALVWSLALAAEKGIPLNDAARAFAAERSDDLGRRARHFARSVERGRSLESALDDAGIRLPTDTLVALRMGPEFGKLDESLRAAAAGSMQIDVVLQSLLGQIIYLMFCIMIGGCALFFLLHKIMPAFVKIFQGFKQPMPSVTLFVLRYANVAGVLVAVAFLILAVLVLRYIGAIRTDPPLLRRFSKEVDEATILRTLAVAVKRSCDLPTVIASLAAQYPKWHVCERLNRASALIDKGSNWCDSLQAAGLLDATNAGVLKAAERTGNLAWAMETTADRLVRRLVTRATAFSSIAFPVLTLIVAAAVCVLAMSIIASLAHLIQVLA